MNEVLAISLQGMHASMARVEAAGMNIANTLTHGYKRRSAVPAAAGTEFAAYLSGTNQHAARAPAGHEVHTDWRPGTLKATGRALDLALAGQGFFEVQTESGPAYTRAGNFRLDPSGRLVTPSGHTVMGQQGEIDLSPVDDPVVTTSGAVFPKGGSEQAPVARLKVVVFEPGVALQPMGDGLYVAEAAARPASAPEPLVRQGQLENANTSAHREMTELAQAMRQFETMSKVAQGYDDMLGTAIRKLGETT